MEITNSCTFFRENPRQSGSEINLQRVDFHPQAGNAADLAPGAQTCAAGEDVVIVLFDIIQNAA
jgi:hypothetical protein